MLCKHCQSFMEKYPPVLNEDKTDYGFGRWEHILEYNEDGSPGVTSDIIRCAFDAFGLFVTDNWSCGTMGLLRGRVGHEIWHNDSYVGVIPIPLSDDPEIQQGMLVLAWYKHRGRTGRAIVLRDDKEPRTLNLKTALFILGEP